MPKKITDLTGPPQVGKEYLVPCIKFNISYRQKWGWLPVLEPLHNDKELNLNEEHWHFDWRFWSDHRIKTHFPVWDAWRHGAAFGQLASIQNVEDGQPTWKRRKCFRQMPFIRYELPEFKAHEGIIPCPELSSVFRRLEPIFRDRRVTSCGKCPHKGVDLSILPQHNGVVVCPAHGLAWHMETEKMIPRCTLKP